jgi:rhodanese-related sulfurtransferase
MTPRRICAPEYFDLLQVKERFTDSEAAIVTACMHGRRGELAAQQLADAGFHTLCNIKGGFHNWVSSNLPSTK